jgi:hypothetical protein
VQIKDRLYLPLFIGTFVFLLSPLTVRLHLPILALLLLIASLPLWFMVSLMHLEVSALFWRGSQDNKISMTTGGLIFYG